MRLFTFRLRVTREPFAVTLLFLLPRPGLPRALPFFARPAGKCRCIWVYSTGNSNAAHIFQSVLLEDGGKVGLRDVVGEGTITEHDSAVAGGGQCRMPRHNF